MQPVAAIRERTRHARPPRPPLLPTAGAALLAAAGGLGSAAAYPRLSIWPLAVVGVAALSVAVDGRRARTGAWLGLLFGLAFFVPLLHWTGIYVGPAPWLILAVAEACFLAALGAVLTLVQRLPGAVAWIGCAWVLEEAARDRWPFGGFPWGRLAFSQQDSPLRWFVMAGGAPLLTFVVALTGGAVAVAAVSLRRPVRRRRLAGALAMVIAVPVAGLVWGALATGSGAHQATGGLQLAVVQGSVPDRGLAFEDRARQVLDNHVAQTLRLAAEVRAGTVPRPDLVIWPENASDVDPLVDQSAAAEITRAVQAVGAPVLVGAILQAPDDKRRNAGILWSPTTGPGAMYVKRHPVPFAEYIPWRSIAEKVSSAAKLVTSDMVAGRGNGLLRGGPVPIGDVICFEVAYDDLVQSSVHAGAQLLVVQTNNATFGHTAETWQQLTMSRLRAIETDRTVVQASTTGVSAIIAPDGSVVTEADQLFHPALLTARMAPRTDETLAVRLGQVPEWTLAALAALAAAASVALDRWTNPRRRTRPQVASAEQA